jgi:hypothetical protein
VIQEIKDKNIKCIEKHLDKLFKDVKNLMDWENKWFFLPMNSNFSRCLNSLAENKLKNLISLQDEFFIDILSTLSKLT